MDPFNLDTSHSFQEKKQVTIEPALSKAAFDAYTKNPYFFKVFEPLLSGKKQFAGFNFFACVFGESWCVYRKMYKLAALILILSIAVAIVATLLYIEFYDRSYQGRKYAIVLGYLAAIALVHIPFGFFANRLYFNKAKADIEAAIKQNLPAEYFTAHIKSAGGINVGGFIALQMATIVAGKLFGG